VFALIDQVQQMLLAEARQPNAYVRLPRLGDNQLKILWAGGWYDGPESGILLYKGKKFYFTMCELLEDDTKILVLVDLSEEQLRREEHWHDLFVRKVGSHFTFCPTEAWPDLITEETVKEFYESWERNPEKPDYSSNAVLGWFTFPGTQGLFDLDPRRKSN